MAATISFKSPPHRISCSRPSTTSNRIRISAKKSKESSPTQALEVEEELRESLRVSVEVKDQERAYHAMQRLKDLKGGVREEMGEVIERWFRSSTAVGPGWLGRGKWAVKRAGVGRDGVCEGCGERLVGVGVGAEEAERFAGAVAGIAGERDSSFQLFQKWLDYHGPFDAVIDAANVGLSSQKKFSLSKVNRVGNEIRNKISSKKWPLIVVHNRRICEKEITKPRTKKLIEKLKDSDAIYATPTGSNDDWYWLYAAIKCKCLIVTNDEMRDHIFQLLGNDVFPKWKERHQVRFIFHDDGNPEIVMPPAYSTVIQESEQGHWHVPLAREYEPGEETVWLCITRNAKVKEVKEKSTSHANIGVLFDLKTAEKLHGCVIDFQI